MAEEDYDDSKYVPSDINAFMKALQDPGKINSKDKAQLIVYPELKKYSLSIAKLWKAKQFPHMPQNISQAKDAIAGLLIKRRNLVDATSVNETFS